MVTVGYIFIMVNTIDMWSQLVELQPQTGGDSGGISREEFIGKIASDIQSKLPPAYDVLGIRKKMGDDVVPTSIVLLQELDRFNALIKKMSTTLMNLQRVSYFIVRCFHYARHMQVVPGEIKV